MVFDQLFTYLVLVKHRILNINSSKMNTLKNIHKLRDHLTAEDLEALDQAAYLYARHAQIYLKIIDLNDSEIIVEIRQEKNNQENYLDKKELSERARSLLDRYFPDHTIHIGPSPYRHPPVDQVTPEWVQKRISKKRISSKEIRDLTGIDKGNISKWISGSRPMSRPVKTMFYLLLKD